jgi:type VI secretion system protein ImpH
MARTNRKSIPTVEDILTSEPYRFEFHQAIKLLEYLNSEAIPFGETVEPRDEVVSIKSRVYLESLSSDIYSLENKNLKDTPPILNVNFMGLAGIQGPLPFPYTEMIIQRVRSGDTSLKDFLDIFNHRLVSILHRIRKQYLISLNTQTPEKTEIAVGLKSFLGLGQNALQNRLHVKDRSLLDYAGLYWMNPRSADGLESILRSYFHIPVKVYKCIGGWTELSTNQMTRIGESGQWQILGQGAVLGTRVWSQESFMKLLIGPLSPKTLEVFLPIGPGYQKFQELVKLYVGPTISYRMNITVHNPPPTHLGRKSYLGWRAWLGENLAKGDAVKLS